MTIPDGIYDNVHTQCRECYSDGRLASFISYELMSYVDPSVKKMIRPSWLLPWGHYPDLPAQNQGGST